MRTDLTEPAFDMLRQPRGPYHLTLAEFEAREVPAIYLQRRKEIRAIEARMYHADLSGTDLQKITPEHELAQPLNLATPGVYVRTMILRAGLRVVGKRHAQEHISIVSCGRATVMVEEGRQEIVGPCQFISPAGTKRFLHVHEDMIWTTVHRTNETDMALVEADLMIAEPLAELAVLE